MKTTSQILKLAGQYFPKYLVLLVLSPIIIGYIIDHELIHPLTIPVNLAWILVFTVPFCYFNKKVIYKIAVVFYFVIGFFEIGHWLLLQGPLTITSLLNIFSTNLLEAAAFLELKSTFWMLLLLPYILLFIIALRNAPVVSKTASRAYFLDIVFTIPLIIFITLCGSFPKIRLVPQVAKVSYAIAVDLGRYNKAIAENKLRPVEARLEKDPGQQTFVLILGESCSRNHMSLYNDQLKTNPKLRERKDIYAFKDVIAPYSYTTLSVPSILSESNLENGIGFDSAVDLLDVFHSAGFKTYWISNQSQIGLWDNIISSIARKADHSNFVNISSNSSQEAILTRALDSKLFQPFKEVLEEEVDKKFIVLHLMGNHNTYSKRYPKSFEQFSGKGHKGQLIAEYRNSILFNDFVVDSLLTTLKTHATSRNSTAAAIYTSDHGENLYDELNRIGHDYAKIMPGANIEIPFVLWLSDPYIKANPHKLPGIHANLEAPYVSDDLFHSIMDINGIRSPYLKEERSLFHVNFNAERKRIMVDGRDYDNR